MEYPQPGTFSEELLTLLNKYSIDAKANTPDWLLSAFMGKLLLPVIEFLETRDQINDFCEKLKGYAKKYGWKGDYSEVVSFVIFVYESNGKKITRNELAV
jgi:hypothetical protein